VVRAARAEDGRALLERLLELTAADDIDQSIRSEMGQRFPGLLELDAAVRPAAG